MTDVRLTALNPEDSTVVPVACNSSGELLVDKGEPQGPDLNVEGDLSVGGSATFKGVVQAESADGSTVSYMSTNGSIGGSGNIQMGTYMKLGGDKCVLNLNGDGSAEFSGAVTAVQVLCGDVVASNTNDTFPVYRGLNAAGTATTFRVNGDGAASFKGDLVVGSRSKSWMLVEQGGLCHMVEQTRSLIDEGFSVDDAYPKLRDVFNELDLIERSLSQVMEKLRLTPPAGWPVWDGSDETQ